MAGFQTKRLMSVGGGWVGVQEPNFKILTTAMVDNEKWYTVSCLRETSIWIRENYADQEDKTWFQNIDEKWNINYNVFDIDEKLYTILALRWS